MYCIAAAHDAPPHTARNATHNCTNAWRVNQDKLLSAQRIARAQASREKRTTAHAHAVIVIVEEIFNFDGLVDQ